MTVACPMTKDGFHNHMRDKAKDVAIKSMHLGDDYAVLEFQYEYKAKDWRDSLKNYIKYYGYRMEMNKNKLVVINTAHV
jgi:hypothetical protein